MNGVVSVLVSGLVCFSLDCGDSQDSGNNDAATTGDAAVDKPAGDDGSTTDDVEAALPDVAVDFPPSGEVSDEVTKDDVPPIVVPPDLVPDERGTTLAPPLVEGGATDTDALTDASDPCEGDECVLKIAPQHLQLWLRSDIGTSCEADRLVKWLDQSGKHHNAEPKIGKVGPRCNKEKVNQRPVLTFGNPTSDRPGEVLTVDLSFLSFKPFTIFIVEKRRQARAGYLLATAFPFPDLDRCDIPNPNAGNSLIVGYSAAREFIASTFASCDTIAPIRLGADLSIDTVRLLPETGLDWIQGVGDPDRATSANPNGLRGVSGGFIGRAFPPNATDGGATAPADTGFVGDIAEIIIFDTALDEDDIATLRAHLKKMWNP